MTTQSSASTILASFVILIERDASERTYRYDDAKNRRQFQVFRTIKMDDTAQYLLVEVTPSNRIGQFSEEGYCLNSFVEPRIEAIESSNGPNGMLTACEKAGIDVSRLIFDVPGYSRNSIFHSSLASCAEAVAHSINNNVRYQSFSDEVQSEAEIAQEEQERKIESRAYWIHAEVTAIAAQASTSGLFKGCHNMLGKSLSKDVRDRILGYLNNPNQDEWNEVRGLLITRNSTLWQAWVGIDSTAPRMGSVGFPSADMLRNAIVAAVDSNLKEIAEKIEKHGRPGLRLAK